MKFKTILYPCDFSTAERAAFDYACELARDNGAKLLIAHVEEPPVMYGDGTFYYGIPEPDHEGVRKMLAAYKPKDPAVKYEHHLLQGDPALEVIGLAERENPDLIVMSSHGRSGLARLVMGSIAEAVMRGAPCPILVVKPEVKLSQETAPKKTTARR
jgi:nucleotide-binding universal stress UspA family protein